VRRFVLVLLCLALLVGAPGAAAANFVPAPPGIYVSFDPVGAFHRCFYLLVGWIVGDCEYGIRTEENPGTVMVLGPGYCQICPPEFFPDGCSAGSGG